MISLLIFCPNFAPGFVRRAILLLLGISPLMVSVFGQDWVHRQGPTRNGVVPWKASPETLDWSLDEPIWTFRAGAGGASPVVSNGRVYTLGWQDGKEILWCLNARSGDPEWNGSYESGPYARHAIGDHGLYKGPSSTPEIDKHSDRIFTLGSDGDLFCWTFAGKTVWHRNLYDDLKVEQRPKVTRSGHRDYGYTSSPVAAGPWCIVEAGSKIHGTVIAFNKSDGSVAWRSECRDEAGHNNGPSPMLIDGVPCLAVFTLRHLVVMRLDPGNEGKTVGKIPWRTDYAQNVASAAVWGPDVIVTSDYNQKKMARYRFSLDAEPERVWERKVASKICTPVIHKEHVYFAFQQLRCLDFKTGEEKWRGGAFGEAGSVIATADDRLVVWGGRGELVLAESAVRSPSAYKPIARSRTLHGEDVWPHVVFVDGRLYLKDRSGLVACYAL